MLKKWRQLYEGLSEPMVLMSIASILFGLSSVIGLL